MLYLEEINPNNWRLGLKVAKEQISRPRMQAFWPTIILFTLLVANVTIPTQLFRLALELSP